MIKLKLTSFTAALSLALAGGLAAGAPGASAHVRHHSKRAAAHTVVKHHAKHKKHHAKHKKHHALKTATHPAKASKVQRPVLSATLQRPAKNSAHFGYLLTGGVQRDPVATIALAPGSAGRPV